MPIPNATMPNAQRCAFPCALQRARGSPRGRRFANALQSPYSDFVREGKSGNSTEAKDFLGLRGRSG